MTGPLEPPLDHDAALDEAVARLLTIGTYASVGLLAAGVLLMAIAGRSPFDGGPPLDPGRLLPDLVGLRPEGLLWLGLIAVVATPAARVTASLVGYLRRGERAMAGISIGILGIILLSVVLAIGTET
jgi:uncharacterized membrane protein